MVKNQPAKAGDAGLIRRSRRPPGRGHGNPLQFSCLGNPTDRGAWWATVPGVTESDMTKHKLLVEEIRYLLMKENYLKRKLSVFCHVTGRIS